MPIPGFNNDGVIPPFTGTNPDGTPNPGLNAAYMSPYRVTASEVAHSLGTTLNRIDILEKWLQHRAAMRALGIASGLQWLDGSFVENKEPNDLNVISFLHPPAVVGWTPAHWKPIFGDNSTVFTRNQVKAAYRLDAFFVNLDGSPESILSNSRYLLQLFSHQRDTFVWKGMLEVRFEDASDDANALTALAAARAALSTTTIQSAGSTPGAGTALASSNVGGGL